MKLLKFNGDQLQWVQADGTTTQSFPASSGPLQAASVDSTIEDRRPVKTGGYHLREGEPSESRMLRFDRDGSDGGPKCALNVLVCSLKATPPDDANLIRVDDRFFDGLSDTEGLRLVVSYEQAEFLRSTFVKE